MSFEASALAGLALIAGLTAVLVQMRRGCAVSLLTLYALLFVFETCGGVVKAMLPRQLVPFIEVVAPEELPRVLAVALVGFLLFLLGYAMLPKIARPAELPARQAIAAFLATRWTPRYRLLLLAAVIATLGAGFVQHFQRVHVAGGWGAFIDTAYQYRFGTFGETEEQNALIVAANLIGPSAVGLFAIALLGALERRISRPELVALFLTAGVLLLRQWSSMFRAALWFTLVSLALVYHLARPLRPARAVRAGLALLTVLAVINFGHQYLFYRTAAWDFQTFGQSLTHLLAPQNQLHTLGRILETVDAGAEGLAGRGFAESALFFVPRWIWPAKAPAAESGTLLVQWWAGLPTWYQFTVTNVGELIAHFGYPGMLGLVAYGWLYRWLDSLGTGSLERRIAVICCLIPRVPADFGSGVSAVAISLFGLALFLGIAYTLALLGGRGGRYVGEHEGPAQLDADEHAG